MIVKKTITNFLLAQQECGELQTFRLQWKFWWDGSHLVAWLHTAAARKVKELDLHIFTDREKLKLPPYFLSCRTLVVLKLSGTIANLLLILILLHYPLISRA